MLEDCEAAALVAQLDRASVSGTEGRRFEPCRVHFKTFLSLERVFACDIVGWSDNKILNEALIFFEVLDDTGS